MAEQPTHERSAESSGLLAGVGAYLLWGLLPIYFKLLAPTGAWEIVGWRIVWSLVLCLGILIVFRRLGGVVATLRSPRALVASLVAGGLLAVNGRSTSWPSPGSESPRLPSATSSTRW